MDIALFAEKESVQAAWLAHVIDQEGGRAQQFDIQLGGESRSRVSITGQRLSWNGMDLAHVRSAYIRGTAPNVLPTLPPLLNAMSYNDWRGQFLREQAYQATTYSFFEELTARGALVVNPLTSAYLDHNSKGQFYEKLRAWGYDAPVTLTTNDPNQAEQFLQRFEEVVVKPAIGVGSTRLVTAADRRRLHEISVCPVLLQERVNGEVVRVHVVGEQVVLALRILGSHVDSRTATEGFEYHRLPEEECRRLVSASRRLNLHFSAWDIMVTAAGRHSYLDCNPGPYILWIGEQFVEAVLTQLARYLITHARTGSVAAANAGVEPWAPPS